METDVAQPPGESGTSASADCASGQDKKKGDCPGQKPDRAGEPEPKRAKKEIHEGLSSASRILSALAAHLQTKKLLYSGHGNPFILPEPVMPQQARQPRRRAGAKHVTVSATKAFRHIQRQQDQVMPLGMRCTHVQGLQVMSDVISQRESLRAVVSPKHSWLVHLF